MLKIHHLRVSQSDRIIWLCEELGLPYDITCYDREPSMAAPPEYRALSAFGTAPVITDGDLALGESGAIVEYICHRHAGGKLTVGPGDANYADYLFWFHFGNGTLMPAVMIEHILNMVNAPPPGASRIDRALEVMEVRLGQAPFFAGDEFSAADIMMSLARLTGRRDFAPYPNVAAYIDRIAARPAWRKTVTFG